MKAEKQLKTPLVVFVIICVLLAIVAGFNLLGSTNSYLASSHSVKITTIVENVKITLMQGDEDLVGASSYLGIGETVIEGDTVYTTDISLKNDQVASDLYVRYRVAAWVNNSMYNITDYITIAEQDKDKFYLSSDGWMYYGTKNTKEPLPGKEEVGAPVILSIMESFTIPLVASSGKLGISDMQGKYFELFLYVETSSTVDF